MRVEVEGVVGHAQLTPDRNGWSLSFAGPAGDPGLPLAVDPALIAEAMRYVSTHGGGPLHVWVSRPSPADDASAAEVGLRRERDLLQMRRSLPLAEAWSLEVRAFVPGQDETAWLAVNNRAFAWHPEQRDWDLATLQERLNEPWFDPAGFLLHERGGRLAGFCWTKIHADQGPPLGEIYVIGVDPDQAGHGLGRALTLAGLDYLAHQGLHAGMLYVDRGNVRARRLYDDLGFTLDHIDRVYTTDVAPGPADAD